MTTEKFFELLEDISPETVQNAQENFESKPPSPVRIRWGTLAACLILAAALTVSSIVIPKAGVSQDDIVRPVIVYEFHGAIYEVLDMKEATATLKSLQLPHKIAPDMVGTLLGTVMDSGGNPVQFYHYLPYSEAYTTGPLGEERPQQAVYVVDTGDGYTFALFCNYLHSDTNTYEEADELFAVYGIDEAEDITSISVERQVISDPETIQRLYNAIRSGRAMNNDSFQKEVMGGLDELEQQALCQELANSAVSFRLTTQCGVVTSRLTWRPNIGLVEWALNYYQLNEQNS